MTTAMLLVASVVIAACSVDGTPVPVGADVSGHPTIPDTDVAAATAPGVRALMARIRAADPCLGLDQTYPARFGSVVRETQQKAQDLTACQVVASGTPGTPQVRFRVTLGTDLSGQTRGGMTAEQSGSHTIYREPQQNPESNSCAYRIPFENSGFGATVETTGFIDGRGSDQAAWPQACATLKEYLDITADKITALTPRATPPPSPSLLGRDPCTDPVRAAVTAHFTGWRILPVAYYPYSCYITAMRTATVGVTTRLTFERDAEQVGDPRERDDVAGLPAQYYRSVQDCSVSVVYRRATNREAWDAHNISVELGDPRPGGEPAPGLDAADLPDYCAPVRDIATVQVLSLR